MKKTGFGFKCLHLFLAGLTLFLTYKVLAVYPIWQATLLMALGTFWLIDLLYVLFYYSEYPLFGMHVALLIGSSLCFLFAIWLINTILKLLNPLFSLLNWEVQIGNLFSDIFQYVFSLPGLVCGIILVAVALIWDNNVQYRLWKFLLGRPKVNGKNIGYEKN